MVENKKEKTRCQAAIICSKTTLALISLLVISVILWVIGCEMLWYGTQWMEKLTEGDRFVIYKSLVILILLGIGVIAVVASAAIVLFGIPFTLSHSDHLFNRQERHVTFDTSTADLQPKRKDSKQAFKWTICILLLVIIGIGIGAVGCEIMRWSGLKFKALFNNNEESEQFYFYLKQWSLLVALFAGLLLFFGGFLLAPFMLAFAGVVSFDKNKNSYRRRRRSYHPITQV